MTREEMIDRLWARCEPILFIEKADYVRLLEDWDIAVHKAGGIPAFITVQRGADFHFDTLETGRQITRKMINDFLQPIIEKYGHAATKTPRGDERQHRFNLAMGFKVVGQDEYDIHYRIDRLRGLKCQ